MRKIVLAIGAAVLCVALTAAAAEARSPGSHVAYARGRVVAAGRHAVYARGHIVGGRHFTRVAHPHRRPWAKPYRR